MAFQEVQSSSNGILKFIIHDVLSFQILELPREHSFLEGGWAGGIHRRVINFLPAQKGRVSMNLTQQRGGSLYILLLPGEGHIF